MVAQAPVSAPPQRRRAVTVSVRSPRLVQIHLVILERGAREKLFQLFEFVLALAPDVRQVRPYLGNDLEVCVFREMEASVHAQCPDCKLILTCVQP